MVAEVVIPVNVAEQDARWRFVAEGCQDTATKLGGHVAGATMLGGPLCKHRQEMSYLGTSNYLTAGVKLALIVCF